MREKSTMVFGNRVFSGADSGAADPPGGSFGPEHKREGIGGEWHDEEKRKIHYPDF